MYPAERRSIPSSRSFEAETQTTGKKSRESKGGKALLSGVIHMGRSGFGRHGIEYSEAWEWVTVKNSFKSKVIPLIAQSSHPNEIGFVRVHCDSL